MSIFLGLLIWSWFGLLATAIIWAVREWDTSNEKFYIYWKGIFMGLIIGPIGLAIAMKQLMDKSR